MLRGVHWKYILHSPPLGLDISGFLVCTGLEGAAVDPGTFEVSLVGQSK